MKEIKNKRIKRLSISTALSGTMLVIVLLSAIFISIFGILGIYEDVSQQAQQNVNFQLSTIRQQFDEELDRLSDEFLNQVNDLNMTPESFDQQLFELRKNLGFNIINICDGDGKVYEVLPENDSYSLPIDKDPVVRAALIGQAAFGTVVLDGKRVEVEGSKAVYNALIIAESQETGSIGTKDAIFLWVAAPVFDEHHRVTHVVYGGKAINKNYAFVDGVRDLLFQDKLFEGKPLGTVTIFLNNIRIATNVIGTNGARAVGTIVSEEVRETVLTKGQRWLNRAYVVDSWYISAYEPIMNPDGTIIGILYVGLLEAPYTAMRWKLALQLLTTIAVFSIITLLIAFFLVRRVTLPLQRLTDITRVFSAGDVVDLSVLESKSYSEIMALSHAFTELHKAIELRDAELKDQNKQLSQANDDLARVNRNYMETLGFVTHELKSPLASMQTMLDTVTGGYVGEVDKEAKGFLERVRRAAYEMQGMVKNYLDLSRAERNELELNQDRVKLLDDVVTPVVALNSTLFQMKKIELSVVCDAEITAIIDQELIRICLTNLLSNACKYGEEGGSAELNVSQDSSHLEITVWNSGLGFSEEEEERLFKKFSRLQNRNTASQRGSGLGLYLCQQIAQIHDGKISATSSPGHWAKFVLSIPAPKSSS